jgi:hypothetical protein
MPVRLVLPGALALVLIVASSLAAAAQPVPADPQRPIGPFVVDVRGALATYPTSDAIAAPRGLTTGNLPSVGLGLDVGAHVYPLRGRVATLGVGASFLFTRASRSPGETDAGTTPAGPTVTTRLSAFSPQVSLNFGSGGGWSYLSGGYGMSTLTASRDDFPDEDGDGVGTFNYGGGARWFTGDHLAVTFDLRFYAMGPAEPTSAAAGHPRLTQFVLSVGVSLRN